MKRELLNFMDTDTFKVQSYISSFVICNKVDLFEGNYVPCAQE